MDLEAVKTATKEAGFELEWAEIEVVGRVGREEVEGTEALTVSLRGRHQRILVVPGNQEETRAKFGEVMRVAGKGDKVLRIRGRARTQGGVPTTMTIKTFEVVDDRQDKTP